MHLSWHFGDQDILAVRNVVSQHAEHPIVRDRRSRNLTYPKPEVTQERFWKALVMALLTTQQPSGPTSPVTRFLARDPLPLSWDLCCGSRDVGAFVTRTLISFTGIRRHGVIGKQLSVNLDNLRNATWAEAEPRLKSLTRPLTKLQEREVADFMQDKLLGLGPKQARNLLQALGLTRYEVPIDSRVARWLRERGFPSPTSAAALADRDFYHFVLDGYQRLCEAADELPCVVDGAVFASFDGPDWTPELVRF